MAHTNIMGFGLPLLLTLPILLQTLLIVQGFFSVFFNFFLLANGPRFADSKRINVSIRGTVVFYSSRR